MAWCTYPELVEYCERTPGPICAPRNDEQLLWLVKNRPEYAAPYIKQKTREERMALGLSPYWGEEVPQFDRAWRERFVATLNADVEFRQAVAKLIGGRAR